MPLDWSAYPNFSEAEFRCRETGRCDMDAEFMSRLQALRSMIGQPFVINSGYRDPSHSAERNKTRPGAHAHGCAADIKCNGQLAWLILAFASRLGFERIGVHQKGPMDGRYIHLDTWTGGASPTVWTY